METIATALLAGFGVIVVLHAVNGDVVAGTTQSSLRAWLDYIFTGRGAYTAAGFDVATGASGAGGSRSVMV